MLSTRFNRWTIAAITVAALAVPGAIAAFKLAAPTPTNMSSLVAAYNYADAIPRNDVFAAHRSWNARFAAELASRSTLAWRAAR